MTLVNIDLRNVAGETGRHDQVVFHAPVHREGSAGQTIQTAPVIVDLEGGIGSVDLDPGPVVVEIRARGWEDTAPKTVMVPEEGPITLTGLLLDAFEWAPVVVSEVRALASRAESAADRAEDVADTFGSLEGVATSVQAAEAAASSAEADRVVVEQAASSASWEGDRLTVLGATSPPLTGDKGDPGVTPHVGANGTWWIGDTDTGVDAQGPKGDPGDGAGDVLWSQLNPVLDGKANIGDVPVTDGGYLTHDASDPARDYPVGVSYGLHAANDGWNAAIQADTGTTNNGVFVMVLTLRQGGYSMSTTQMVFSYDNEHKPVFMRKWHGEAWGPFRSLTDDGHTHSQYATTTQVEARTPEIRVVSSPELATSPGVLYVVMED